MAALERFAKEDHCRILLATTKALSQQMLLVADTLINFELPQKDAPRMMRLPASLTIINLVAEGTLEEKMAQGLLPWRAEAAVAPAEAPPLTLRQTYRQSLTQILAELKPESAEEAALKTAPGQILMDFAADETDSLSFEQNAGEQPDKKVAGKEALSLRQVEPVMRSAVEFFSQVFKLTSGQQIEISDDMMNYDPKTGEVTLKFKIAGKG